jgi:hypothetical protein
MLVCNTCVEASSRAAPSRYQHVSPAPSHLQVKKMRTKFDSNVKFIVMNSFSTSADTKAHLSGTHPDLVATAGWELLQNKSPKVDAATLAPVEYPSNPDLEWCVQGFFACCDA